MFMEIIMFEWKFILIILLYSKIKSGVTWVFLNIFTHLILGFLFASPPPLWRKIFVLCNTLSPFSYSVRFPVLIWSSCCYLILCLQGCRSDNKNTVCQCRQVFKLLIREARKCVSFSLREHSVVMTGWIKKEWNSSRRNSKTCASYQTAPAHMAMSLTRDNPTV